MNPLITMDGNKATNSSRIERWLGAAEVNRLSEAMRTFYHPIALHGVPGNVYAMPGGDFTGEIHGGYESSSMDRAQDSLTRFRNEQRARLANQIVRNSLSLRVRMDRRQHAFANLSALIAARTGGKGCDMFFAKTNPTVTAVGGSADLWFGTGQPTVGATAATAGAGTVPNNTTVGNLGYINAVSTANSGHFVSAALTASVINNTLMLYDRIFAVAKTMNSTATEAVTGVPTRYSNQTSTAADYIGGNFCFPVCNSTVLAATAHNWTVCQYTDQAGNATQSFPSATGISACPLKQIDLAVGSGSWFMPLASGDTGVMRITQMQCSAAVATGTIEFVICHPIAFLPCPVANLVCIVDGINTAFNLVTVYDNACLGFLEMPKPATTGTAYAGQVTTVSE